MIITHVIITDLDKSIFELSEAPDDDNDDQRQSRNAEIAGEQRRKKLESFCKGNKWVNAYYANYTFEIDFLLSDNSQEIIDTLDAIYKREADIKRSSKLIKNDDLRISGKEVLRLAEKLGKGWFALMVVENVYSYTNIPYYILRALAFAYSEIINDSTIRAMGLYRIRERKEEPEFKPIYENIGELKKKLTAEFIKRYTESFPEDQLTKFFNLIKEERDEI